MKFAVAVFLILGVINAQVQAGEIPDRASWSKSTAGQSVDLSLLTDLEGHGFPPQSDAPIIMLHFWATWCEPCMEELPKLDALAKNVLGRRVVIFAVSEDRGGAPDVQNFKAKHVGLMPFQILLDPNRKLAKQMGISILPTTVLVKGQTELDRLIGSGLWDAEDQHRLGNDIGN